MILAYAFDAAGLPLPNAIDGPEYRIEWVPYRAARALDEADGVIVIQGVFEHFKEVSTYFESYTRVTYDEDLMLTRERQLLNLLNAGGWVCFLVREIRDHARGPRDTDLCKRFLTFAQIDREALPGGLPWARATRDEFKQYVQRFGVVKVRFEPRDNRVDSKIPVKASADTGGIEVARKTFFLPLHTTNQDDGTSSLIARLISDGVVAYRRKEMMQIPAWAHEIRFKKENGLLLEQNRLQGELSRVDSALQEWSR